MNLEESGRKSFDGTRRTRLAEERTYLAWLRSGFAAFALSLGAGKVVPYLTHSPTWPYTAIGVTCGAIGVLLIVYGLIRHRSIERAISTGTFALPNTWVVVALSSALGILGIALIVVILLK